MRIRAASRPQGGKLEQFVGDHSSSAWLADTGGREPTLCIRKLATTDDDTHAVPFSPPRVVAAAEAVLYCLVQCCWLPGTEANGLSACRSAGACLP